MTYYERYLLAYETARANGDTHEEAAQWARRESENDDFS